MLESQPWIYYVNGILFDWKHSFEEGKDVDKFKEKCLEINDMSPNDLQRNILADEMYHKLKHAPIKNDFQYIEPSDLETIKAVRPKKTPISNFKPDKAALFNKIYGAWLGRVAGCLLGKPIECWHLSKIHSLLKATDNYPLSRYISSDISDEIKKGANISESGAWINKINNKAPVDDDTNYTILGLKILEKYGRNFTSHDVGEAWLSYVPYLSTCTAERVAYKNIASGIFPPQSADHKNPFREWIGAQIRADFYGYINPGNPEIAAEMAWRDAAISHIKNGIYGAMFVAAMLAVASITSDIMEIIKIGLSEIPEKCRLSEKIHLVLSWYKEGIAEEETIRKVHEIYNEMDAHDWCHTISNAMIVVIGLLYGNNDFEKSICLAVQAGFDTDCNGATVGSIIGMILGADKIPDKWTSPFNDLLATTMLGYEEVKLSEVAKKTLELID